MSAAAKKRPNRVLAEARAPRSGPVTRTLVALARRYLRALELEGTELSLSVVTDAEIREINRAWRKKDKPTDVLSFPAGEQPLPPGAPRPLGDVIISLTRFQAEGERLLSDEHRKVGVRIEPDEAVEALAYDLPRISVVALAFPKFRDGRAYSAARILRERFDYAGQIRAVGDVLREQALFMIRCGFDAFEPADGSTAADWAHVAARFRHVYQRAADDRCVQVQHVIRVPDALQLL